MHAMSARPEDRTERALTQAIESVSTGGCPPRLAAAVRHAVFPAGARIRPRLCLAVAMAHGDTDPLLSDAAAAAIELLHCASLVHDDLPCFDNAAMRRGVASVHQAFGERLAVLAGDALIVTAFQLLGQAQSAHPERLAAVLSVIAQGVGMPMGITAGQAWECEAQVPVRDYHRAKTGALFAAATMAGALSAGGSAAPWRSLGECLGEAYQVADDIRDVAADPLQIGKPVGRDLALGRPSVALQRGALAAVHCFQGLIDDAIAAVPVCPGANHLRALVRSESERLVPNALRCDLARAA